MMKSSIFAALRQSKIRKIIILAFLFALFGSTLTRIGHAESAFTPVNGTVTIINNGIGDQVDPHISGGLVTYSSIVAGNSSVHYYDFLTGSDASIPQEGVSLDYLSDVSDSTIVYTQVTSNSYAINLFDTSAGGAPITLDPHPSDLREKPVIGGQTIVWADYGFYDNYLSEIVIYDRLTGEITRLTEDLFSDFDPNISPDGSLIVWTKCQNYPIGCRTWQAAYNGSGWDTIQLPGSGDQRNPTTDGQFIAYDSYRDNNTPDSNIFWQVRGGGEEHEISLPGNQSNPAIDGGLVVFRTHNPFPSTVNWDILLYDLNIGAGYQVSNAIEYESQPDIEVAPDGFVRVVWSKCGEATGCDIYASTFSLPETGNQPPVIDHIIAPLDPMIVNSSVSVAASFSDPDIADTHTAVWDWGDDSTESGLVSEADGTGTVSGSYAYATPGVYVVTLIVTDNHDAEATALFQYVVVYDPRGGFVTGSGWIESLAGAYALNPDLTGRAHFGFVSRYQKGASFPSGQTDFQFNAADLSFRSTAYDWLVVAGAKAQFKGQGTLNGSGVYGFLLTVTDSQVNGSVGVDKFRIKIWDRSSGEVVYDNQLGADETADPSTTIGGGSIVIHK